MTKTASSNILLEGLVKIVPTLLIVGYLWSLWQFSSAELSSGFGGFMVAFATGLTAAYFLYAFQIRFSITFALLLAVIWGIYQLLAGQQTGEFDILYYSISFLSLAVTFVCGWLIGFGFARWRHFPWVAAVGVLLLAGARIVAEFPDAQNIMDIAAIRWLAGDFFSDRSLLFRLFTTLAVIFGPVIFYAAYILFTDSVIRKSRTLTSGSFWFVLRRSSLVTAILTLLLIAPFAYVLMFGLPDFLEEQIEQAATGSANFLKKTYNEQTQQPEFDLQDYAQLLPEIKLSDETVFCTYIDNFFPTADGDRIPLPVHFRRYVLNRYEPRTEKFVLDPYPPSSIPSDLFSPKTRDVPIGFSVEDSTIESEAGKFQYRKDISSTVYIQTLSPDAYVAPNTGYSYKRMPVPPEDKETFHTVYQCSSQISIFNLPPFMFSTNNPELVEFREMRAENLRSAGGYDHLDSTFINYYTQIEESDTLIGQLAEEITGGLTNPFDKVQAVVDYFAATDDEGEPIYTYTLEPGSPRDPSQSFMHYFLFENKRGYCTYFAGATTLLLRAAGIPTRMTVGYAIYDRSNKNTGWYWVYADQGHAWVEAYFPGYGWIDFDTTPGADTEPVRPPKPDATPPEYARTPIFGVIGKLTGFAADSSSLQVRPYKISYDGQEIEIPEETAEIITIRPNDGTVTIDDEKRRIGDFEPGKSMVLSAYSFDYDLEQIGKYNGKTPFMQWMLRKFPPEIPVDEAIVIFEEDDQEEGLIFAVTGRILSMTADSSALTLMPGNIYYRGKDYPIDGRYFDPLTIRPKEAVGFVDGEEMPLSELMSIDSLLVSAESSDPALQSLKPYLATEPFRTWFRNSFPAQIPVSKIVAELPKTPLSWRLFRWFITIVVGLVLVALLFALLVYVFLRWQANRSPTPQRLYWVYRLSLMVLHQMGIDRVLRTPLEFANDTVDPEFNTQFGRFMNLYLRAKYANTTLSSEEKAFVEQFNHDFRQRVFNSFSRWDIVKSFANCMRTLQFLIAR